MESCNSFQIEVSSKYSTVDTLKQQYLLVPSMYKVSFYTILSVFHLFEDSENECQLGYCFVDSIYFKRDNLQNRGERGKIR